MTNKTKNKQNNKKEPEDTEFQKLQKKSKRDEKSITILNNAIKSEKKSSVKAMIYSVLATVVSTAILTAVLNGNDNINTNEPEKTEPTSSLFSAFTQDKQITHVKVRYQKDGKEKTFNFSFEEQRDDEHPTIKYIVGDDGLDEIYQRIYSSYESDLENLTSKNEVNGGFDIKSLADNPGLRRKIAKEALKAGFIKETGLTELPPMFSALVNNEDTVPGQEVYWYIDIDGDDENDALKIQRTHSPAPRDTESVTRRISLKDNTYCTSSTSKREFNDTRVKVAKRCQKLDTMDTEKRSDLFAQFNAQKLFNRNNFDLDDAVISAKTVKNKTTYSVTWANK